MVQKKAYDQEPDIQNVQKPVVLEEPETQNNIDQSINAKVETECDFNFYFPTTGEPDDTQGTYKNTGKFASAMLKGEKPTLLFHQSQNYIDDRDLKIERCSQFSFLLVLVE